MREGFGARRRAPDTGADGRDRARVVGRLTDCENGASPGRRETVAGVGAKLRERRQECLAVMRQFAKESRPFPIVLYRSSRKAKILKPSVASCIRRG